MSNLEKMIKHYGLTPTKMEYFLSLSRARFAKLEQILHVDHDASGLLSFVDTHREQLSEIIDSASASQLPDKSRFWVHLGGGKKLRVICVSHEFCVIDMEALEVNASGRI